MLSSAASIHARSLGSCARAETFAVTSTATKKLPSTVPSSDRIGWQT
jgi:hypothetical protein